MRKAYLHVGMPKTGTSAIQAAMAANRTILGRHGILYPGHHDDHVRLLPRFHQFGAGHYYFAHKGVSPALAKRQSEGFLKVLERDAEKFQGDLLLSSEYLFNLNEEAYADLQSYFCDLGYQLNIICYLRHPLAMATSSIQQNIKMGHGFLTDYLTDPQWHSMKQTLEPVLAVLGRDRLVLRIFEQAKGCGAERDILQAVKYRGALEEICTVRTNTSLSMTATLLIDALNRLTASRSDESWALYAPIKSMLMQIGGVSFRLPEETEAIVMQRAQPELEWLSREFGISFLEPKRKATPYPGLSGESSRDLLRVIARMTHRNQRDVANDDADLLDHLQEKADDGAAA